MSIFRYRFWLIIWVIYRKIAIPIGSNDVSAQIEFALSPPLCINSWLRRNQVHVSTPQPSDTPPVGKHDTDLSLPFHAD